MKLVAERKRAQLLCNIPAMEATLQRAHFAHLHPSQQASTRVLRRSPCCPSPVDVYARDFLAADFRWCLVPASTHTHTHTYIHTHTLSDVVSFPSCLCERFDGFEPWNDEKKNDDASPQHITH